MLAHPEALEVAVGMAQVRPPGALVYQDKVMLVVMQILLAMVMAQVVVLAQLAVYRHLVHMEMAALVLQALFLEQLSLTLVEEVLAGHHQAVLGVAVLEVLITLQHLELLTQEVAVAALMAALESVAQAVQALLFFATPATFNISLVVQYLPVTVMLFILLHRQAH
jgi:hypothetical protein